jgi:hypothetical protein
MAWDRALIMEASSLTPDMVLVPCGSGATPRSRAWYREISFARRLVWQYGVDGALERLNAPAETQRAA